MDRRHKDEYAIPGSLEQTLHFHFTHTLQGLVPNTIDAYQLQQVLDIHCRSGAWAIDLALSFPGVRVIGIDEDPTYLETARQYATVSNLTDTIFEQADLTCPLPFHTNSFDFIHLLTTSPLLKPTQWDALLLECQRILKHGQSINLIGTSFGPGSSTTYQQMTLLRDRLLRLQGYSFADSDIPRTSHPGPYFSRMLHKAHFTDIQYKLFPINYGGFNNAAGRASSQYFLQEMRQSKELLVQYGLVTATDFDALLEQKKKDIAAIDYCATGMMISATAVKG